MVPGCRIRVFGISIRQPVIPSPFAEIRSGRDGSTGFLVSLPVEPSPDFENMNRRR